MRTANFKSAAIAALLSMGLLTGCTNCITNQKTSNHMDTLNLTQEWDKKFPQSDKVNHRKVTFKNRYGITLAADLYEPKNIESKLPAIAVSGPFGAVRCIPATCAGRIVRPFRRAFRSGPPRPRRSAAWSSTAWCCPWPASSAQRKWTGTGQS